jgi:ABC-type enterochelin transport system substrate-binding protein
MDKENRKGPSQENCQVINTVVINGISYHNVPDEIQQKIEKIAKIYGTPVKKCFST